jgi:hypothetical protein
MPIRVHNLPLAESKATNAPACGRHLSVLRSAVPSGLCGATIGPAQSQCLLRYKAAQCADAYGEDTADYAECVQCAVTASVGGLGSAWSSFGPEDAHHVMAPSSHAMLDPPQPPCDDGEPSATLVLVYTLVGVLGAAVLGLLIFVMVQSQTGSGEDR